MLTSGICLGKKKPLHISLHGWLIRRKLNSSRLYDFPSSEYVLGYFFNGEYFYLSERKKEKNMKTVKIKIISLGG